MEKGLALPVALLLLLFITASAALLSDVSMGTFKQTKIQEAIQDTFQNAEGAVHEVMRQMSVYPELWRARTILPTVPASYTSYSPLTFSSSNGIPTCSGAGCHRNLYPVGGGLIKNFGAEGAGASDVDAAYPVTDQLDPDDPPTQDIQLNGQSAWVQVERLDETLVSSESLGGSLDSNPLSGTGASEVRFRLTGVNFRTVRDRRGLSTVVYIVALPSS